MGAGGRASAHLEPDLLGKSLVEGARAAGCVQAHLRRQGPALGYRDMTLSWHGSEQLIRQSSDDNKGKQPAAWAFVGIAAGITDYHEPTQILTRILHSSMCLACHQMHGSQSLRSESPGI